MPLITSASVDVNSWESLRVLAAKMIDDQQAAADLEDVSCRSGCVACCNQPVPVGPAEIARIMAGIDALDPATGERVHAQIAAAATSLRAAGFASTDLIEQDPSERPAYAARYFSQGVPCPILDGDTCSLRDERPLVCRDYLVTSDPEHCASFDHERVVRIRRTDDVYDNFRRIESEAGSEGPFMLALALDEVIAEPAPFGRSSVVTVVQQLRA